MVTNLCGAKVICALFLQLLLLSIHTYVFPFSASSAQQLGPRHHVCPCCVPLATFFKFQVTLRSFSFFYAQFLIGAMLLPKESIIQRPVTHISPLFHVPTSPSLSTHES